MFGVREAVETHQGAGGGGQAGTAGEGRVTGDGAEPYDGTCGPLEALPARIPPI